MDEVLLEEWSEVSQAAVLRSGRFAAALSGGKTPVSFYKLLAASGRDLPWAQTHIFPVDERAVPADHPDSNFRMIHANLLRHVPIPAGNIHPVRVDLAPGAAAEDYEKALRRFFGLRGRAFPRFDLILLGLGKDGHTASLFPEAAGLEEARRLALAVPRPAPEHDRVSLTLPTINAAKVVVFLVAGAEKAAVLKAVLEGPSGRLPAALVRPRDGRCVFIADKAAGALLTSFPRARRPKA